MVHKCLCAAVALCCLASSGVGAPDRAMVYRWSPGKTTRYRLIADLSGSMPIMGSAEPVDLEAVLTVIYRVTPRKVEKDGAAVVEFRVESAEAEVVGIPLSVPMEDARKTLDRTVTFAPTGEVTHVEAGPPLPFALTIPGVDPQRLYTLVCPVVFPSRPVAVGDAWDYRSELLGSEGAPAKFRATVVRPPTAAAQRAGELRIAEEFTMDVNQTLDADRKAVPTAGTLSEPAPEPAEAKPVGAASRTRKGTINGAGVMVFDPVGGSLLRGHLTIQATITEKALGEPAPDEVAEVISRVKAVVRIAPIQKPAQKPQSPRSATKAPTGPRGR